MLAEIQELQNDAVSQLIATLKSTPKDSYTFRAPTGSGKTYMMADFMNRMIEINPDIVFLVSSLSKSDLAVQNYEKFCEYRDKQYFKQLNPYLMTSNIAGEERLHIPSDFNVYLLPRDLYKDGSRLMQGPMVNFLTEMRFIEGKTIIWIKDECHIATSNLDAIAKNYFDATINFSATPKLSRGQYPDVEITDSEAEQCGLIKRVVWGEDDCTVEDAIKQFKKIKTDYRNLLGVNPCLIIQISNKAKADEELENEILPALNNNPELKWIDKFLGDQKPILAHKSIFEINRQLKSIDYTVKDMIYDYATDYSKWWLVSEHAQDIAKESRQYMCDYSQSMVLGSEESFSDSSYYSVTDKYVNISNWVWKRRDGAEKFSFDSEAEKDWAAILKDISASSIASVVTGKRKKNEMAGQKNLFGEIEKDTVINEKEVFLWGKNFVPESGIKFEYYLGAVHSSYPDFVMKDKFGRIHIFEVKSVNQSASFGFDNNIYISKVTELKKCYKQASIVTGHIFYLPIMKEDVWRITKYQNGIEETLTIDQFRNFVLNK